MSELKLLPGPRLERREWVYDHAVGKGEWVHHDVTERACEFLFREIEADPEVTLSDVFALVMDDPVMQLVFRQEFVKELCEEVRKGPVRKTQEPWEKIEYLELYRIWTLDTTANKYGNVGRLRLHGMGIVQETDVIETDYVAHKKGERINWGVSMTPVRELLHLPIRVQEKVLVCEDDLDAKKYGKTLHEGTSDCLTLGSYIREVLWELSWHGTPEDTEKVSEGLKEQLAELDAGTATTVPCDDLFESLGFVSTKVVYAQFFVNSEDFDDREVYRALHELEDSESAVPGLSRLLEGQLQLRAEHHALSGHALRKAVREAQYDKHEDSAVALTEPLAPDEATQEDDNRSLL